MRKPLVVYAKQVQNRSMQVANMNGVIDGVVAEFIGPAVSHPRLYTTTGHPHRKAAWMMIASALGTIPFPLPGDASTKLTAPQDERLIQQPSLFEVGYQRGTGLICVATASYTPRAESAVMIPIRVKQLYEANAAFDQSSRQNAVRCVATWTARSGPV
ncbi:MAG: hypothetical protein ACI9G1_004201, partial [Pirellulaceae bacterium]